MSAYPKLLWSLPVQSVCSRSVGHDSNRADRFSWEIKIFNSFCSRPQQLSTYALTLYKHTATVGNKTVAVGMSCAFAFILLSFHFK